MKELTKHDALELIKLLSAVESWSFATNSQFPDYLSEKIDVSIDKLSELILCELDYDAIEQIKLNILKGKL